MKQKQLLILLVFVVALGGAGYVCAAIGRSLPEGGNPLSARNSSAICPSTMSPRSHQTGHQRADLAKKDDPGASASATTIRPTSPNPSEFLIKAQDLKIVQVEAVGPLICRACPRSPGRGAIRRVIVDLRDKDGSVNPSPSVKSTCKNQTALALWR